jgi:UTP--glucose-1-phosphate uridylyltransferase
MTGMVEKPPLGTEPSNLFISGRYILQPEIFNILETQERGAGGEIQLTDGIMNLLGEEKVMALEFDGDYFDVGTIPGWLKTCIALGRAREEFRDEIDSYLRELLQHAPDRPPATG